jgi:hypothetical protein
MCRNGQPQASVFFNSVSCADILRKTIPLKSPSTVTFLDGTPVKRNYAKEVGPNSREELPTLNFRERSRKAVIVADVTLSYRDQRVA